MAFFDFLHIFTDLFNSIDKAWNKLEPEVQNALLQGSGVISLINQNLQVTPPEVFDLIQKKFPNLTQDKLTESLGKVSAGLNLAQNIENPNLFTTIQNLQTYFSTLKGKSWEGASSTMSQLLSSALAPDETPFAKISMFIEFVYRKKIKA